MGHKTQETYTAFFYGTLMSPPILHRVLFLTSRPADHLSSRLTISPATLHNYCRHRVRDADYPGVVPEEGKSVRGTYVTGLTRANISNLDVFEGGEYERRPVKVRVLRPKDTNGVQGKGGETNGAREGGGLEDYEEGTEVETETYVFLHPEGLERREWDFEEFVREKAHRWVFCDEEYAGMSDGLRFLYRHMKVCGCDGMFD